MKKFLTLGLMCIGAFSMTSCLGTGSNETSGTTAGVVEYHSKVGKNVVYINDFEFFYVPKVATDVSIQDGDCCMLGYQLNYDAPENTDAYQKGYYTAQAISYVKMNTYETIPSLTDTTKLLPAESAISNLDNTAPNERWGLIRNKLFINTYHKDVLTNMKADFDLSFDSNAEPVEVMGKRVYNLYLRMVVTDEGESPMQSVVNVNTFKLRHFMEQMTYREKSADKDEVCFRINYIKDLEKETLKPTWTFTEPYIYKIPKEDKM